MNFNQTNIPGLLALLALLPFTIGLLSFKTSGLTIRVFLLFLFIGILTDNIMWWLISHEQFRHLLNIFNVYSIIECAFFFWIIQKMTKKRSLKSVSRIFLALTVPFWVVCIFIYPLLIDGSHRSVPFDTTYEVIVSFLGGLLLLEMIEGGTSSFGSPYFWITVGIFFYCFCTFFLMSLLETLISQKIWFMNNIINVITYFFYSVGMLKLYRQRKAS